MDRKKLQYLVTGGPVPRRTVYKRKKALEARKRREVQLLQAAAQRRRIGHESSESTDDEQQNRRSPTNPGLGKINYEDTSSRSESDFGYNRIKRTNVQNDTSCSGDSGREDNPRTAIFSSPTPNQETANSTILNQVYQQDECVTWSRATDNEQSESETSQNSALLSFEETGDVFNETVNVSGEEMDDELGGNAAQLPNEGNLPINLAKAEPMLNKKLCGCSETTEGDAFLLCLSLGIRHNLNWVAMTDILKMINQLYGYEAVSASKYFLHKYLDIQENSTKYHLYCPDCEIYLGSKSDVQPDATFNCECTANNGGLSPTPSYFISIDLADQLRSLLRRDKIANEIMTYRFTRSKQNQNGIEDIYDGQSYRALCEDGQILSNPCNFSYTFNTDGVQIGKSGTNAAWPIFISINELSPQERKKNMLFAGVWVGKKQPNMQIFLQPFVDEANKLSTNGFDWKDSNNVEHHSKIIPLCCVVDSAARYKLLNMQCYSGYFGCTFCYQKAENTAKGRRFTIPSDPAPLRTHQSIKADMEEAFHNRNHKDKKKGL